MMKKPISTKTKLICVYTFQMQISISGEAFALLAALHVKRFQKTRGKEPLTFGDRDILLYDLYAKIRLEINN